MSEKQSQSSDILQNKRCVESWLHRAIILNACFQVPIRHSLIKAGHGHSTTSPGPSSQDRRRGDLKKTNSVADGRIKKKAKARAAPPLYDHTRRMLENCKGDDEDNLVILEEVSKSFDVDKLWGHSLNGTPGSTSLFEVNTATTASLYDHKAPDFMLAPEKATAETVLIRDGVWERQKPGESGTESLREGTQSTVIPRSVGEVGYAMNKSTDQGTQFGSVLMNPTQLLHSRRAGGADDNLHRDGRNETRRSRVSKGMRRRRSRQRAGQLKSKQSERRRSRRQSENRSSRHGRRRRRRRGVKWRRRL